MREIKFRAWDYEVKKMLSPVSLAPRISEIYGYDKYDSATSLEFMQSTGLLDKNGTPIYEGDILQMIIWEEPFDNDTFYVMPSEKEVVQYDVPKYGELEEEYIAGWKLPDSVSRIKTYWQVVGNVYQNPELLSYA